MNDNVLEVKNVDINEIEYKVANGEMTAMQVFTKMKHLVSKHYSEKDMDNAYDTGYNNGAQAAATDILGHINTLHNR